MKMKRDFGNKAQDIVDRCYALSTGNVEISKLHEKCVRPPYIVIAPIQAAHLTLPTPMRITPAQFIYRTYLPRTIIKHKEVFMRHNQL